MAAWAKQIGRLEVQWLGWGYRAMYRSHWPGHGRWYLGGFVLRFDQPEFVCVVGPLGVSVMTNS